jgi:serine/threonine-protein kinase
VHRAFSRVPAGLSAIVARAMARDPDQRYPSARHLSTELRHWSESAEARTLIAGARAGVRAALRRAAPWVGSLTAGAALAAAAGLWWWHPTAADRAGPAASGVVVDNGAAGKSAATGAAARAPKADAGPNARVGDGARVDDVSRPGIGAASTDGATSTAGAGASGPLASSAGATPPTATASNAADASAARVAATGTTDRAAAPAGSAASAATTAKARRKVAPSTSGAEAPAVAAAPALGVVQLAVIPWGQVEVDGQPMGTSPPLTRLTLTAGNHTVTVRNADFPSYSTTLRVDGENPVLLRHRFGP